MKIIAERNPEKSAKNVNQAFFKNCVRLQGVSYPFRLLYCCDGKTQGYISQKKFFRNLMYPMGLDSKKGLFLDKNGDYPIFKKAIRSYEPKQGVIIKNGLPCFCWAKSAQQKPRNSILKIACFFEKWHFPRTLEGCSGQTNRPRDL